MKKTCAILLTIMLLTATGCNPLIGGLASVTSFGAGYWTAMQNPRVETTREYYIDGVKVEDPAALGLE